MAAKWFSKNQKNRNWLKKFWVRPSSPLHRRKNIYEINKIETSRRQWRFAESFPRTRSKYVRVKDFQRASHPNQIILPENVDFLLLPRSTLDRWHADTLTSRTNIISWKSPTKTIALQTIDDPIFRRFFRSVKTNFLVENSGINN